MGNPIIKTDINYDHPKYELNNFTPSPLSTEWVINLIITDKDYKIIYIARPYKLEAYNVEINEKYPVDVISKSGPELKRDISEAKGYLVEGPTWAPNGRVLMYFKQEAPIDDGKSTTVNLFKIDVTGFRETRIVTPSDGSDPAWSPLLPN